MAQALSGLNIYKGRGSISIRSEGRSRKKQSRKVPRIQRSVICSAECPFAKDLLGSKIREQLYSASTGTSYFIEISKWSTPFSFRVGNSAAGCQPHSWTISWYSYFHT